MKVNFMTFNIRHDPGGEVGKFDALPSSFLGEQPWSLRKYKVADTVLMWSPDIVGFQEPEYHQVIDLERLLNDEYEWVGAGRDDGKEKGEYCPVFYKRDMLRVENWRNLWLSETPDEPGSRSWDASAPRIATVVEFTRLEDNIKFTVLNAHFDHQGIESRRGAANVILEHIKNIQHMCVLMGDLNSPEDDPGYVTLTGKKGDNGNTTWLQLEQLHKKCSSAAFSQRQTGRSMRTTENNITLPTHRVVRPGQVLQNLQRQQQQQQQQQQSPTSGNVFLDTRYLLETRVTNDDARAPLSGPYGDQDTFTSFGHNDPDAVKAPRRLDYIMVAKHDSTRLVARRFGVLSNLYDDGFYISDHRPVVAVLDW